MKIRTSTNYAPRSMGSYNWAAWDDENDGEGCLIGMGDTQSDAIDDLLDQAGDAAKSRPALLDARIKARQWWLAGK